MSSPAGLAPRKIVLAYSGGLDTSCIIPWLKEQYGNVEVIATAVDVGQPDDLSQIEAKALASGAAKDYVIDAREEFLRDYVFPTMRAGAVYERKYLLGTSMARPVNLFGLGQKVAAQRDRRLQKESLEVAR